MEIMVSGGAGFIGSHVIDLFLNSCYRVVIADDLSIGCDPNSDPYLSFHKVKIPFSKSDKVVEQTVYYQLKKEVVM